MKAGVLPCLDKNYPAVAQGDVRKLLLWMWLIRELLWFLPLSLSERPLSRLETRVVYHYARGYFNWLFGSRAPPTILQALWCVSEIDGGAERDGRVERWSRVIEEGDGVEQDGESMVE